jgi:elongation factor G
VVRSRRSGLPRIVVVNRLDRERGSLDRTLESLRRDCGREIIPVQLPLGEEKAFIGVVDLVTMKAQTFAADGKMTEADIPSASPNRATRSRAADRMVAEADEQLMEPSLPKAPSRRSSWSPACARRHWPASSIRCSARQRFMPSGMQPLLDAIVSYAPSRPSGSSAPRQERRRDRHGSLRHRPLRRVRVEDDRRSVCRPHHDAARRVRRDQVRCDGAQRDARQPRTSRPPARLQGKTQTHVPELKAGDLGAVAKLKDTHTNDVLADKGTPIRVAPISFPEPVLSYAIEPKSRGDEDKISSAMHRLEEEDPSISYARDPQTHELLLAGQGQLHIEVTVAKLKRRFGVEVNLKPPRIPYRETITASTEAHGRHKKQTGGHGQFGDCKIRVEPLPRGSDFQFEDDIFGGAIPRQYVPAVEKGIQESRMRGYLAGFPMVDFKATVFDGSYHAVDSNELSFKMAGSLAFKDAMTRARPTILEPIMKVEVYTPSDFAGDLMGDLNGRRGRIAGMDTRGTMTVIAHRCRCRRC